MTPGPAMLTALLIALGVSTYAAAAPRVMSLDSCADQYVMALSPREAIVGVSHRADDHDSRLASSAAGLPRRRATLEAVLASRPDVVVRYWGGDARLVRRLEEAGIAVVTIEDATDFDGVRRNVRTTAAALGRERAGEDLLANMDAALDRARRGWAGQRALYLTAGGYTAGPGTLIGSVISAAGLRNAATDPGYAPVSIERLVVERPTVVVYGFFDDPMRRRRAASSSVVRQSVAGAREVRLPSSLLGCPAWFAADAAELLAREARR